MYLSQRCEGFNRTALSELSRANAMNQAIDNILTCFFLWKREDLHNLGNKKISHDDETFERAKDTSITFSPVTTNEYCYTPVFISSLSEEIETFLNAKYSEEGNQVSTNNGNPTDTHSIILTNPSMKKTFYCSNFLPNLKRALESLQVEGIVDIIAKQENDEAVNDDGTNTKRRHQKSESTATSSSTGTTISGWSSDNNAADFFDDPFSSEKEYIDVTLDRDFNYNELLIYPIFNKVVVLAVPAIYDDDDESTGHCPLQRGDILIDIHSRREPLNEDNWRDHFDVLKKRYNDKGKRGKTSDRRLDTNGGRGRSPGRSPVNLTILRRQGGETNSISVHQRDQRTKHSSTSFNKRYHLTFDKVFPLAIEFTVELHAGPLGLYCDLSHSEGGSCCKVTGFNRGLFEMIGEVERCKYIQINDIILEVNDEVNSSCLLSALVNPSFPCRLKLRRCVKSEYALMKNLSTLLTFANEHDNRKVVSITTNNISPTKSLNDCPNTSLDVSPSKSSGITNDNSHPDECTTINKVHELSICRFNYGIFLLSAQRDEEEGKTQHSKDTLLLSSSDVASSSFDESLDDSLSCDDINIVEREDEVESRMEGQKKDHHQVKATSSSLKLLKQKYPSKTKQSSSIAQQYVSQETLQTNETIETMKMENGRKAENPSLEESVAKLKAIQRVVRSMKHWEIPRNADNGHTGDEVREEGEGTKGILDYHGSIGDDTTCEGSSGANETIDLSEIRVALDES
eukprot:g202.t1